MGVLLVYLLVTFFAAPAELSAGTPASATQPSTAELDAALAHLETFRQRALVDHSDASMYSLGEKAAGDFAVLSRHTDTPRVMEFLDRLARIEPRWVREGEATLSGRARILFLQVRGREQYDNRMRGATDAAARVGRVRAFFKEHPELLKWHHAPDEQAEVVRLLLDAVEADGGADVIDLLAPSGRVTIAYLEKYPHEAIAYLKKIGPDRADSMQFVVDRAARAQSEDYDELFREWLKDAQEERTQSHLVRIIGERSGGRAFLLMAINDPRPSVVQRAAYELGKHHAEAEALRAIRATVDRLRAQGGKAQTIQALERAANEIDLNIKKGGGQ